MRDVLRVAVAEMARARAIVGSSPGCEQDVFRQNLDALNARVVSLSARGVPAAIHSDRTLIINGADLETFAALVRHGAGGFEQHQAAAGIAGHDAAAQRLTGQRQKIAFVIVTAQGKFETVLARRRAMAGARAATRLGQHRLHVVAKAPLEGLVHVFDRDFRRGRLFADCGRDV